MPPTPPPVPPPPAPSALHWTTESRAGSPLTVRSAPIPTPIRESIARALDLGPAATNTTTPPPPVGG